MKINLGSGWKYLEGWTNCDLYAERVDVRCDCRSLPFADGTVDEVMFNHCIEHVSRADGIVTLQEIHRVLMPGGVVSIETPDRLKLIDLIKGHGPKKSKGLNVVEGTRAATGLYYPDSPKLLDGVKGAVGGISGTRQQKAEWHGWLKERKLPILAALEANDLSLMPIPANVKPGEAHIYIWHAEELADALMALGFRATTEDPQAHGQRTWRDCRVVGVKL